MPNQTCAPSEGSLANESKITGSSRVVHDFFFFFRGSMLLLWVVYFSERGGKYTRGYFCQVDKTKWRNLLKLWETQQDATDWHENSKTKTRLTSHEEGRRFSWTNTCCRFLLVAHCCCFLTHRLPRIPAVFYPSSLLVWLFRSVSYSPKYPI